MKFSNSLTFPGQLPGFEYAHDFRRDRLNCLIHSARKFLSEITNQQRDVAVAFLQRGHHNGKNIQPVVQVSAKFLLPKTCGQVAVGGCQQPDIHPDGAIAAQPFEFLLLKHAQKFGLQLQRKVSNLVQK